MALLTVSDLKVHYPVRGGFFRRVVGEVKAVDGISFELRRGETYGLVGESGCGKTTTGRAIIGLIEATSGNILLEETTLTKRSRREHPHYRKDIQMIFQDPYSSLNPRKRVLDIVAEPLRNFERMSPQEEKKKVQQFIEKVGLHPEALLKYPHEFSGGQRQRIGIARALMLNPKIIIADEPVSALDVSVQAQVLNFLKDIQQEFQLTYLLISHDLGMIRHMCDRIGIMYRGRLVEEGTAHDLFHSPQHIYAKRLISAIPNLNPHERLEQKMLRQQMEQQFEETRHHYFDREGRAHPLKRLSDTHSAAIL
ncbi:ABC transporter ATP-binding protein [Paenibacillus allorhizosphaerae]|uniref:Oligopeptide transport ATP-binding protein OppF n=1 Tax=Paenibacillus allorhizosphaerae TaxID=2849866 RepID=A0ABM8VJI0_9BACL|nr:ATP-binding cassette domain-containing protein [Paenibacillus allorhizosphaerae]CAG7645337.1 Oligopeptide transport ATP-binding protein OppF [Paenibacillus allorhizosphaerae]